MAIAVDTTVVDKNAIDPIEGIETQAHIHPPASSKTHKNAIDPIEGIETSISLYTLAASMPPIRMPLTRLRGLRLFTLCAWIKIRPYIRMPLTRLRGLRLF